MHTRLQTCDDRKHDLRAGPDALYVRRLRAVQLRFLQPICHSHDRVERVAQFVAQKRHEHRSRAERQLGVFLGRTRDLEQGRRALNAECVTAIEQRGHDEEGLHASAKHTQHQAHKYGNRDSNAGPGRVADNVGPRGHAAHDEGEVAGLNLDIQVVILTRHVRTDAEGQGTRSSWRRATTGSMPAAGQVSSLACGTAWIEE